MREYSDAFLDFDALRGALEVISVHQFLNETIRDVKTRTHLKSLAERATNGGRRRGEHDARAADEDEARLGGRRPRRDPGARDPREPGPTCLVTFVDVERRHGSFWLEGALHEIRRCDGFLFDKCSLRCATHRLKIAHRNQMKTR